MRLNPEQQDFIRGKLLKIDPKAVIYLFGSRVDDMAKGGDIDILILSESLLERKLIREFKINFYKKFGWQKIDIVNFLTYEDHPFKNIALENSIQL